MPPSASCQRPRLSVVAPVNAPRTWPNSSDSISSEGIAPQLTATKGLRARGLRMCMARATTSLPVPDSPVISTGRFVLATRPTSFMISTKAELTPMSVMSEV